MVSLGVGGHSDVVSFIFLFNLKNKKIKNKKPRKRRERETTLVYDVVTFRGGDNEVLPLLYFRFRFDGLPAKPIAT